MLRYELITKRTTKHIRALNTGDLFLSCGDVYRVISPNWLSSGNKKESILLSRPANCISHHWQSEYTDPVQILAPDELVLDKNGYIQLKETEKKQVPFCDLKIGDAFSYKDNTGFENIGIKVGWYTHVFGLNGIFNEYKSEYDYIMVTPLSPDEIRIWNE
jgi:hypothetical protein